MARKDCTLPRLFLSRGETEEACSKALDRILKLLLNDAFIASKNTYPQNNPRSEYRSYGIYEGQNNECVQKDVQHFPGQKKPLVWAFSGGGAQFVGMGVGLLKIPMFKASIDKLQKIMEPRGVNIIEILTSQDPKIHDGMVNKIVGITAVEIAFVDILRVLNLVPDYIFGYSIGEIAAAYADGCLTAEEAILSTHAVAIATSQSKTKTRFAIVGIGHQKLSESIPAEIEIAGHLSPQSSAMVGPIDIMTPFMASLETSGVFVAEIQMANVACHSNYLKDISNIQVNLLKTVIKNPKLRSKRWLSSSVPKSKWNEPEAIFFSAEYINNNTLNVIYLQQVVEMIPKDSVVLDLSPDAIMKMFLLQCNEALDYIVLSTKSQITPCMDFFAGLGQLFLQGFDIPLVKLYSEVLAETQRNQKKAAKL